MSTTRTAMDAFLCLVKRNSNNNISCMRTALVDPTPFNNRMQCIAFQLFVLRHTLCWILTFLQTKCDMYQCIICEEFLSLHLLCCILTTVLMVWYRYDRLGHLVSVIIRFIMYDYNSHSNIKLDFLHYSSHNLSAWYKVIVIAAPHLRFNVEQNSCLRSLYEIVQVSWYLQS